MISPAAPLVPSVFPPAVHSIPSVISPAVLQISSVFLPVQLPLAPPFAFEYDIQYTHPTSYNPASPPASILPVLHSYGYLESHHPTHFPVCCCKYIVTYFESPRNHPYVHWCKSRQIANHLHTAYQALLHIDYEHCISSVPLQKDHNP